MLHKLLKNKYGYFTQRAFITLVLTLYTMESFSVPPDQQCHNLEQISDINPGQELSNIYQLEDLADIKAYESKIAYFESENGAFNSRLIPELVGLGLVYRNADMYREASEIFQRTLHLIRVNEGLDSVNQLHVIELLIESNTEINDWEKVADNHDLMYWIYKRNYSLDKPRFLPILKKLRTWYMQSYNKDTGRSLSHLYNSSEKIYNLSMEILGKCTRSRREALCFWYKGCCEINDSDYAYCPIEDELSYHETLAGKRLSLK